MKVIDPPSLLDAVGREVAALSLLRQLALGVIICERYMPEYQRFVHACQWGNPDALQRAIRVARGMITDHEFPTPESLKSLLQECIDATPDTGDFETVLADYAQDSAIMVCHLVQFMAEQNPQSIAAIASRARDLVDAKVQFTKHIAPNDPQIEAKIATDPLMQTELIYIEQALQKVKTDDLASILTRPLA